MATRTLTAFAAFLLLFTFAACAPADRDEAEPIDDEAADAPPAELTSTADRYVAAWNGEDPAAVAEFYTENASVTVGDTTYQGQADIEQEWVGQTLPVISDLRETESSWESMNGDWRNQGRYTGMMNLPDQDAFEAPGSYNHEWTEDADGQWRIRSSNVQPDELPEDEMPEDDQAQS
jgi:ketosteroid isomerase-like protein